MSACDYKGLTSFPHVAPNEASQKLSSLKSKVKERQAAQQQRERMLSELTAQNVTVENEEQLIENAARNHYSLALVLMLQAVTTPELSQYTLIKVYLEIFIHTHSHTPASFIASN